MLFVNFRDFPQLFYYFTFHSSNKNGALKAIDPQVYFSRHTYDRIGRIMAPFKCLFRRVMTAITRRKSRPLALKQIIHCSMRKFQTFVHLYCLNLKQDVQLLIFILQNDTRFGLLTLQHNRTLFFVFFHLHWTFILLLLQLIFIINKFTFLQ